MATRGLSKEEAEARLRANGPNEIAREERIGRWRLLLNQFRGAMTWLLLAACGVSAALGEVLDAGAIAVVLVLNAVIGFMQEDRAENAMAALRALTAPRARVRRSEQTLTVPASEIVLGDLLVLDAGDIVPADAKLIEAHSLSVNEAALTGESVPVDKSTRPVDVAAPLAERTDHVFMGTAIANGSALAEVVGTAMQTELGRIAGMLDSTKEERTPLERRLDRVGQILLFICLGIAGGVAGLGFWRGDAPLEVLMTSVSLAVAAVPEGLAAIVTISLAVGVQRMAKRNVLVRRLNAVETLGCTTVICSDKTGTLTTGVMRVREIWGDARRVLENAVASSDAELADGDSGTGDMTEIAILLEARKHGIEKSAIEAERERRAVHPFDSDRKRMSIERSDGVLYVKGAIESLLPLCVAGPREDAPAASEEMAHQGLRVLAVAVGTSAEEAELELVGLVGIADPPRDEAKLAVARAHRAGIRVVMITGDHPVTARAIAGELGITKHSEDAHPLVHARAAPSEKIEIVRGWKERGAIVAMTGDGVNDAPALKEAHIGIAMGITGTEVAREAASIVLTDDNFASIVEGIREGRGAFENIRKTLVYLLSGNACELALVFGASLFGLPIPLTALQILWINLVTDGLPAIALVMDPADEELLDVPPRPIEEPMLGRTQWLRIGLSALLEATVVGAVFVYSLRNGTVEVARSITFFTLVFSELFRAFASRSSTRLFLETPWKTNLRLIAVVFASALLQIGLWSTEFTTRLFRLEDLDVYEIGCAVIIALIPTTILELLKVPSRWR